MAPSQQQFVPSGTKDQPEVMDSASSHEAVALDVPVPMQPLATSDGGGRCDDHVAAAAHESTKRLVERPSSGADGSVHSLPVLRKALSTSDGGELHAMNQDVQPKPVTFTIGSSQDLHDRLQNGGEQDCSSLERMEKAVRVSEKATVVVPYVEISTTAGDPEHVEAALAVAAATATVDAEAGAANARPKMNVVATLVPSRNNSGEDEYADAAALPRSDEEASTPTGRGHPKQDFKAMMGSYKRRRRIASVGDRQALMNLGPRRMSRSGTSLFRSGTVATLDEHTGISQSSTFKKVWCWLRILCVLYYLVATPIRFGLTFDFDNFQPSILVDYVLDVFMIVDIVLHFFVFHGFDPVTAEHICDIAEARSHYIESKTVIWDVLASLPVEFFGFIAGDWKVVYGLRLLRLLHLRCMWRHLDKEAVSCLYAVFRGRSSKHSPSTGFSSILPKVGFVLAVLVHLLSCIWSAVDHENGVYEPVVPGHFFENETSAIGRYFNAVYFIIITMTGVGYGEIVPIDRREVWYVIVVELLGYLISGSVVGLIIPVLANASQLEGRYQKSIARLRRFMVLHSVPRPIAEKVLSHRRHMWKSRMLLDENRLLDSMPERFRIAARLEIVGHVLETVPFLWNCPRGLLRGLVLVMHSETWFAGTTMYHAGQTCDALHFLVDGCIERCDPSERQKVQERYESGQMFDIETFLWDQSVLEGDLRVPDDHTHCDMFVLRRDAYHFVAKSFPKFTLQQVQADDIIHGTDRRKKAAAAAAKAKGAPKKRRNSSIAAKKGPSPLLKRNNASRDVVREVNHGNSEQPKRDNVSDGQKSHIIAFDSAFRGMWDFVSLVLTVYYVVSVPFYAAFIVENDVSAGSWVFLVASWLVDAFFATDIYLRLKRFAASEAAMADYVFVDACMLKLMNREEKLKGGLERVDYKEKLNWKKLRRRRRHAGAAARAMRLNDVGDGAMPGSAMDAELAYTSLNHHIGKLYRSSLEIYFDICGCIPLEILVLFGLFESRWLPLLRLNRLLRVHRAPEFWNRAERMLLSIWRDSSTFMPVFRLSVLVVFYTHVFSSMFYLLSFLCFSEWDFGDDTWVFSAFGSAGYPIVLGTSTSFRYLRTFFWGLITLVTIGYGGIVPRNGIERMYTVIYVIFGTMLYLSILASLTVIAEQSSAESHEHEHKTQIVNKLMDTRKINLSTKLRVRQWFALSWSVQRGLAGNSWLSRLPTSTRQALFSAMPKVRLNRVRCLSHFSPSMRKVLSTQLQSSMYTPKQVIIHAGSHNDHVFMISAGTVEVKTVVGMTMRAIEAGGSFGSDCLWREIIPPRPANYVSATLSLLFVFSRSHFLNVVRKFPEDVALLERIQRVAALEEKKSLASQDCKESEHSNGNPSSAVSIPEVNGGVAVEAKLSPEQNGTEKANRPRFKTMVEASVGKKASQGQSKNIGPGIRGGMKVQEVEARTKVMKAYTTLLRSSSDVASIADIRTVSSMTTFRSSAFLHDSVEGDERALSAIFTLQSVWNCISMAFLFYFCIIVPWRVAFLSQYDNYDDHEDVSPTIWVDSIVDIFFMVDVYLRIKHFGMKRENGWVFDRNEIWSSYRWWLAADILAMPWDLVVLIAGGEGVWVLYWLRLTRLLRLYRSSEYRENIEALLERYKLIKNVTMLGIVRQFIIILFYGHCAACCWYLIGVSREDIDGWRQQSRSPVFSVAGIPPNDGLWVRYLQSLYFIFVTISTCGYGDIRPRTGPETLFTIFLVASGCIVYAGVVASIASMAANLDVAAGAFEKKVDEVKHFMAQCELPEEVQRRVRAFFEYNYLKYKGVEEEVTLESLPSHIRADITWLIHGRVIENAELFRGLKTAFLRRLTSVLHPMSFSKGDYMFRSGEFSDVIHVLRRGRVLREAANSDKPGSARLEIAGVEYGDDQEFPAGSVLGAGNIFSNKPIHQEFSVKCLDTCRTLMFKQADAIAILSLYPEVCGELVQRLQEGMDLGRGSLRVGMSQSASRASMSSSRRWRASHASLGMMDFAGEDAGDDEEDENSWFIPNNAEFLENWAVVGVLVAGTILFLSPLFITFGDRSELFVERSFSDSGFVWPGLIVSWFLDIFVLLDWIGRMRYFGTVDATDCGKVWHTYTHRQWWWWHAFLDAVMILPIDMVLVVADAASDGGVGLSEHSVGVIRLNKLLFITRLLPFLALAESWMESHKVRVSFIVVRITKLALLACLMLHWSASFWYFIGVEHESSTNDTWLDLKLGIIGVSTRADQYLYAVYWSLTTISSVGYGDITSSNSSELVLNTVVLIIGDMIYGAVIGSITMYSMNVHKASSKYYIRIRYLRAYITYRKLPWRLGRDILKYEAHMWNTRHGHDDHKSLAMLPASFHEEVAFLLYGGVLRAVHFFADCPQTFLARLAMTLESVTYLRGDVVMEAGDPGFHIFFLDRGVVRVMVRKHGVMVREVSLAPPSVFGDVAFFMGSLRSATVRAHTNAEALMLSRRDFDAVIAEFPLLHAPILDKFLAVLYPDMTHTVAPKVRSRISAMHRQSVIAQGGTNDSAGLKRRASSGEKIRISPAAPAFTLPKGKLRGNRMGRRHVNEAVPAAKALERLSLSMPGSGAFKAAVLAAKAAKKFKKNMLVRRASSGSEPSSSASTPDRARIRIRRRSSAASAAPALQSIPSDGQLAGDDNGQPISSLSSAALRHDTVPGVVDVKQLMRRTASVDLPKSRFSAEEGPLQRRFSGADATNAAFGGHGSGLDDLVQVEHANEKAETKSEPSVSKLEDDNATVDVMKDARAKEKLDRDKWQVVAFLQQRECRFFSRVGEFRVTTYDISALLRGAGGVDDALRMMAKLNAEGKEFGTMLELILAARELAMLERAEKEAKAAADTAKAQTEKEAREREARARAKAEAAAKRERLEAEAATAKVKAEAAAAKAKAEAEAAAAKAKAEGEAKAKKKKEMEKTKSDGLVAIKAAVKVAREKNDRKERARLAAEKRAADERAVMEKAEEMRIAGEKAKREASARALAAFLPDMTFVEEKLQTMGRRRSSAYGKALHDFNKSRRELLRDALLEEHKHGISGRTAYSAYSNVQKASPGSVWRSPTRSLGEPSQVGADGSVEYMKGDAALAIPSREEVWMSPSKPAKKARAGFFREKKVRPAAEHNLPGSVPQ